MGSVKALVDLGACVDAKDKWGKTPLGAAISRAFLPTALCDIYRSSRDM